MKKSVRQLELQLPRPAGAKTPLPPDAAACLAAIKSGLGRNSRIAIAAKLDEAKLLKAIRMLSELGLVERQGSRKLLAATVRGKRARVAIVKPAARSPRGRKPDGQLGSSFNRMIEVLETPKSARDVAKALGVSTQRVMQLLLRHVSAGTLRAGDQNAPSFIIARAKDTRRLLTRHEARVLGVLPEREATALGSIAAAAHLPRKEVDILLWALSEAGLAASASRDLWRLTVAGARHFQRDGLRRRATAVRLPVYSARVVSVLSALAADGPARASELAESLGVQRNSMNALMQYLKRRGLIRKTGLAAVAPHTVTALGRDTLEAIRRRANQSQH